MTKAHIECLLGVGCTGDGVRDGVEDGDGVLVVCVSSGLLLSSTDIIHCRPSEMASHSLWVNRQGTESCR